MAKEDKKIKVTEEELHKIKGTEEELHSLFRETLDGLRDDLIETDENVQLYFDAILNDSGGKELYGSLYNDALKIKGSARDRTLKFLALYKDRVNKKEDMALKANEKTGSEFAIDHSDLNELVGKIKLSAGEDVKPYIKPLKINPTRNINIEENGTDEWDDDSDDTENDYDTGEEE